MLTDLPIVEPYAVPEIYADGLARIERIGPNFKFTFFSLQRPIGGDVHDMERVVVARIILSGDVAIASALQSLAATGTTVFLDKAAH